MPPVVIDNPILNSPFLEPNRHFRFSDEGITDEIAEGRRESGYFLPIASPRKKSGQMKFDTEWTQDRFFSSPRINRIRERVNLWRQGGYVGVTRTTLRLLEYWNDPGRERKLFFCQIEALETAIYLTEVASGFGDAWIENDLRQENADFNGGLPRLAMKMATGSGKTVVMGMLIAWQALNKLEDKHDRRFSDAFLIVAPGITIRDRLRVLLPQDPTNYYRERDLVPSDLTDRLGQARIVITNYHAFIPRERGDAARLTKSILTRGALSPFIETPDQMVRRVCRELGGKKQIIVLNDEAHHCYRGKPREDAEALIGDDRVEAKKRDEEARVWMSGLEAVHSKLGLRAVYDLSATPFFLKARRVAISIGPEHGTVGPTQVKEAAKEAVLGVGYDLLVVCGFAFDPHASEEAKRYGTLQVLTARMNPDLSMGDELLKKTGAGNLFMVFGEPDVEISPVDTDGNLTVTLRGVDVYDPTTGAVRSNSTDDIACWFIDTNYDGESFFVRHAYFTGADEPYEKLKRALRADIDEAAWSTLYSTVSRPFAQPETGKIAVKVINHYGDEVLKVFTL